MHESTIPGRWVSLRRNTDLLDVVGETIVMSPQQITQSMCQLLYGKSETQDEKGVGDIFPC